MSTAEAPSVLDAADPDELTDDEYDARLIIEYLQFQATSLSPAFDFGPPGSAKADGSLAQDNQVAQEIARADPRYPAPAAPARPVSRGLAWDERESAIRFDPGQHPRDAHGRWAHIPGATGRKFVAHRPALVSGVREVPPEQFSKAFESAFKGSPYSAFVTHHTPGDIRAGHMTPLLTPDGKAGALVHDHGDGRIELTGLFNTSGQPGMGLALGKMSVSEYGVNYAECYGPVLPEMYATAGFKDTSVFPFDPSQAAPDWDYQRFDNPSYHLMALPGSHVRAAASGDSGLDLARIRDRAEAKDPVWWAQHGDEAFAAALAVFGVTSPDGGEPDDSQPPVPASRGLVLDEELVRDWTPGLHPRDWKGRFGRKGSSVAVPDLHDPAALKARTDTIERKVTEAQKAGLSTVTVNTIGGNGQTWTPERAAIHNEIVNAVMKRAESIPDDGKVILSGGLPGAGKTTALQALPGTDPKQYLDIAPDDFKEELARRGLVPDIGLTPMEASPLISDEAHHIANMVVARATAQRKNMMIDLTMHPSDYAGERIEALHKAGYKVEGVYVHVPIETSVDRVQARYLRGATSPGLGGRYVPPGDIRSIWGTGGPVSKSHQEFDRLKARFDKWELIDNSVSGKQPALLASGGLTA